MLMMLFILGIYTGIVLCLIILFPLDVSRHQEYPSGRSRNPNAIDYRDLSPEHQEQLLRHAGILPPENKAKT